MGETGRSRGRGSKNQYVLMGFTFFNKMINIKNVINANIFYF